MNLNLKNKTQLKHILFFEAVVVCFIFIFLLIHRASPFTEYDYKVLDLVYRWTVKSGNGPKPAFFPGIVYISITDSYYNQLKNNKLDRTHLARLNNYLSTLDTEAVAYDIIFSRPSDETSDMAFTQSLKILSNSYLPVGSAVTKEQTEYEKSLINEFDNFSGKLLGNPKEKGVSEPYHATRSLFQLSRFARTALGSGDISAPVDSDNIYRHMLMLVKVNETYLPTLSLSMFLDWSGVGFEDITVYWGKYIHIPAGKSSRLEQDVNIPIDRNGLTFIPFIGHEDKDFPEVSMNGFFKNFTNPDLKGNFIELFEGNFVFIADTAVGTSDLGATPLHKDVPLVIIHASMLNAMLTNTFYDKWSVNGILPVVIIVALLLGIAACFRSFVYFYLAAAVSVVGISALTWHQFNHFSLFPVSTMFFFSAFIFLTLIVTMEIMTSKERAFIRNTFAKYVPEKVVKKLLSDPKAVQLGGQEMELTVLFTDIAGFTTLSEKLPPQILVSLINEYFSEMTKIIHKHHGIIDKYQGDAIMAEFGIPLPVAQHADLAVQAALDMHNRLEELQQIWAKKGLPQLKCRIGINSGKMIVGNMGSDKLFDYTVMGDAVNLSSRLEGANKRYGTSLLISQFTYKRVTKELFNIRIVDVIRVKGKTEPVKVYEVYGYKKSSVQSLTEAYANLYNNAFESYLNQNFPEAAKGFRKAADIRPEDPAAQGMLERIKNINANKINKDWDGSIQLKEK